jgi:hypothetical protein
MNVLNERSAADPVSTPSLFSRDAECDHTTRVARRDQSCWTARNWLMKEVKMLLYKPSAPGIALGVILAGFSMSGAHAVQKVCKNDVCGRTTYDGTRVNIYLTSRTTWTHYNFKTNPGDQIEISDGHYSFVARPGRKGTYSAQTCTRGQASGRSLCFNWSTFKWIAIVGQ